MITITTILFQGNYQKILNPDSWFLNYNPTYDNKKLIVVNNVNDRPQIEILLNDYKKQFSFDYFFVEDYEQESIKYFNLDIDKNKTVGYYYIIPYFTLILKLETDFVFHISEDCMNKIFFDESFISNSIEEIQNNPFIFSTTLSWGTKGASMGYDVGEWEQICTFRYKNKTEEENKKFWYTIGFSDQVFVSSKNKLIVPNYILDPSYVRSGDSPTCQGVPYCPESWERRVSEYIYKNDMYRGVWKNHNHYYLHEK